MDLNREDEIVLEHRLYQLSGLAGAALNAIGTWVVALQISGGNLLAPMVLYTVALPLVALPYSMIRNRAFLALQAAFVPINLAGLLYHGSWIWAAFFLAFLAAGAVVVWRMYGRAPKYAAKNSARLKGGKVLSACSVCCSLAGSVFASVYPGIGVPIFWLGSNLFGLPVYIASRNAGLLAQWISGTVAELVMLHSLIVA